MSEDEMRWHQRFAAAAYNRVWELMDATSRSDDETAEMLAAAFAQRHHWFAVGAEHNKAIADWQVARALSLSGDGALAVRFAEAAVARAETCAEPDFLRASCYEGLARAHAAAGDGAARDTWVARARDALGAIADDDDRALITSQIDEVP